MYKKIISTTTEETFESDMPPMAHPGFALIPPMLPVMPSQCGNTVPNTSNMSGRMSSTLSGVFTTIKPENSDDGVKMRLAFRDYFHKYNTLMRAYLLSLANGTDDGAAALDKFKTHAADFSKVANLWIPGATPLYAAFSDASNSVVDLIKLDHQGVDTTAQQMVVRSKVEDFAKALQNYNSLIWPTDSMVSVWKTYTDDLMSQLAARKNKLWAEDLAALDNSYADMEIGYPGAHGLADILSFGIMQWTPWRFQQA